MTAAPIRQFRGHYPHAVPAAKLPDAIKSLLECGGATVDQLAKALSYSKAAIRPRLQAMEAQGLVHRAVIRTGNVLSGRCYEWRLGFSEKPVSMPMPSEVDPLLTPARKVTRMYPPVNRRDPLVAALFGPAGVQP